VSVVPDWFALVAEDDADLLHLVCSALQGAGLRTASARTASEAEQLLDRDDLGLLVTDVGLGRDSGVAVAARARELRPDLPVLFVSGRPDLDHGLDGPVAVLGKPFSLSSLVKAAQHVTGDLGARRPAPAGTATPVTEPARPGDPAATGGAGVAAELVGRLLDAREQELAAVAGHLHDDLLQKLAAVTLRLGLLRLRGFVTPEGEAEVGELEQVLLGASDRVRTQILDLSPSWLDDATLGSSLDSLAARHPGLGLEPPDHADAADDTGDPLRLRIGRRGHRVLQALVAELATWTLEAPVEVTAALGAAGVTVRITALGSPAPGLRPALTVEEVAALSGVALEVEDLRDGTGTGTRWTLHLA
jgi:CheY-like chemotaxis protein